jgi:hypothetical protein
MQLASNRSDKGLCFFCAKFPGWLYNGWVRRNFSPLSPLPVQPALFIQFTAGLEIGKPGLSELG